MKALVLTEPAVFEYKEVPNPLPAPDEVLIRLKACSICGSDIHGCQGGSGRRIPPVIMGHEASGLIEDTGSQVKGWKKGDRVTFDSTEYCGHCENCRKGMTNLCQNRKIVGVSCADYKKDGAMAELIAVKAHTLYAIPDSVSFTEACLIEPLSVGLHAVHMSAIQSCQTAVVIGDGTIGMMTLFALQAAKVKHIIMIGLQDYRLKTLETIPNVTVINSKKQNPLEAVMDLTNHQGADMIYDAVGLNQTMNGAFSYVKNGGKIICIGNAAVYTDFPLQDCIVRQIQVQGSYSSAGEYSYGLKLMEERKIDISPFTQCTFPLSKGEEAFRLLISGKQEILKIILTM